jgi:uncharacterized repeat protein (TIGR01451 family)
VEISASTISDNHATERGGGIYHDVGSGGISLTDSTVSGNLAAGSGTVIGGGIYNSTGSIHMSGSELLDNQAASSTFEGVGGGLYNVEGIVDISSSQVFSNSAIGAGGDAGGGGICIDKGHMTVSYSTVSGNISQDSVGGSSRGGGIWVGSGIVTVTHSAVLTNQSLGGNGAIAGGILVNSGTLVMTNSTVSGNVADADGGGIYNVLGSVLLDHVTVTENIADQGGAHDSTGGGLFRNANPIDLKNALVAGNIDGSPTGANIGADCWSQMTSHGYNLIGDETGCEFTAWQASDQVGGNGSPVIDPLVDPLADNGGATPTHALKSGSPAVDAGSCTDIGGATVSYDQRLVDRPQGAACDIGAYEAEPSLFIAKTAAPGSDVPYHGTVSYTIILTNSGAGDALSVDVADVLPAHVVFSRWLPGGRPAGATMTGGNLAWNGTVSGAQTVSFAFVVTHSGNYGERITNTALFNHASGNGSGDAVFSVQSDPGGRVNLPILLKNAQP